MQEKAQSVDVKPFKPRSGVTIHTNDEEAKEAEMQGGSEYCHYYSSVYFVWLVDY